MRDHLLPGHDHPTGADTMLHLFPITTASSGRSAATETPVARRCGRAASPCLALRCLLAAEDSRHSGSGAVEDSEHQAAQRNTITWGATMSTAVAMLRGQLVLHDTSEHLGAEGCEGGAPADGDDSGHHHADDRERHWRRVAPGQPAHHERQLRDPAARHELLLHRQGARDSCMLHNNMVPGAVKGYVAITGGSMQGSTRSLLSA